MSEEKTAGTKNTSKRRWRFWLMIGLACLFVLLGAGYGIYWWTVLQYYSSTEDAYVHGNRIMLTPQISGTVTKIYADDTDLVHAGQPVIALDRSNEQVAMAHATADLAETVRQVHQLYAEEAEQKATVAMRRTQLKQAKRDFERNRRLIKAHGVSRKDYQHSDTALRGARARLAQARHKLEALQANTAETTIKTHPRVLHAAADVRAAWLNLRRTHIPAPVTGYIAKREVQVGEKVDPSKPMLAIVPLDQVWVEANFKETQLAHMRIGQPVELTSDFYGDNVVYHGHVVGVSAGTGSAFELLPPQNATGNWIKIVRRVPVRIRLKLKELRKHPLRLGLSMHVQVDVHDTNGPVLAAAPPSKPAANTDVYHIDQAPLQALIARIIAGNDGKAPPAATQGANDAQ